MGSQCSAADQAKAQGEREWSATEAVKNCWSRNVLVAQIESKLHLRKGSAITNFTTILPAAQSELEQQLIKDPYVPDYKALANDAKERDLENALIDHLRNFSLS